MPSASAAKRRTPRASAAQGLHYRIHFKDLHAHLFGVTLTIAHPAKQQTVSMPVWLAGSYMVREFSKQMQSLRAQQGGHACTIEQINKSTWCVHTLTDEPLQLHYDVHAYDDSVRTAWLDPQRAFFNNTSLCLQVHGQTQQPHYLEIALPTHSNTWRVATGLTPQKINARGFGLYVAQDYDELVDCPFEIGDFWSGSFSAHGIEHRFVVAGAPSTFDGQRLLQDSQQICETAIRFWHDKKRSAIPFKQYVFMLNAVHEGYGGLEHRNSTALICQRADLPRRHDHKITDGYTTLLGLISHEYFHTWNVKRLRPAEFTHYDYAQENYTQLLWFFEGFTSYYDDKLLRRAGLIDDRQYLRLLNKTVNQVLQTPGRFVQSVAQSSFDAWIKYYRADANTPNLTVSYYTKGALVALCLDLSLRQQHQTSLDEVMRALWKHCKAGPMKESDLLEVLHQLTQRRWTKEIKAWVHGTRELPLESLLTQQGVQIHQDPAQLAQRLGVRVSEDHSVHIKQVLQNSPAHQAGFAPGDEWLGIEQGQTAWRIQKLDDLLLYAAPASKLTALVSRQRQLLKLRLQLPTADDHRTWRLAIEDAAKVAQWLA